MTKPKPAIRLGHGNPVNPLLDDDHDKGWAAIGVEIPLPKPVLCPSARRSLPIPLSIAMPSPPTIRDSGGFSREPYEAKHPIPGDLNLIHRAPYAPLNLGNR